MAAGVHVGSDCIAAARFHIVATHIEAMLAPYPPIADNLLRGPWVRRHGKLAVAQVLGKPAFWLLDVDQTEHRQWTTPSASSTYLHGR